MSKKVSINFLKESAQEYILKDIESVTWKDGSISSVTGLYLGVVNFHVAICQEGSIWNEPIEKVKEIEFK